jgi:hypothetical protein
MACIHRLCRPFRADWLANIVTQGNALGYQCRPFRAQIIWGFSGGGSRPQAGLHWLVACAPLGHFGSVSDANGDHMIDFQVFYSRNAMVMAFLPYFL